MTSCAPDGFGFSSRQEQAARRFWKTGLLPVPSVRAGLCRLWRCVLPGTIMLGGSLHFR